MPHSHPLLKPPDTIGRAGALSAITGVYPIEVQRDAGGVQVSLARQFKAWLFLIQPFVPPAPTTTDGVAYYAGVRVRLDAGDEYAAHEPADVPLFDPIAKEQPRRELRGGDLALATFNADSGRWEIVRDPGTLADIVRFRLDATLSLGGTAAATILVWDGDSYEDGDEITVEDWTTPGRWSAVNGAEGVAVKLADKEEYIILWIEHQAIFATATLTANMTAGTAACTFTDTWQGPSGVGSASQVYDVDGRYAGLLIGDKVLACWDDVESKYKICDGPQSQKLKWAYATADWINGALNTSKVVCEAATGKDGGSAGGGTFDVWLPRPSGSVDPNVRQGTIIGYLTDDAGLRIAVTGYLDDCLGTIKIWSGAAADIKPGWQLCDGTNGTPNLREKFVLPAYGDAGGDSDFDGEGGNTTVGSTGGLKQKLVNWPHTMFGSEILKTFNVLQSIVQSESFSTEENDPPLAIAATGTADISGTTDYAKADIRVVDPQSEGTNHPNHKHPMQTLNEECTDRFFAESGLECLEDCTRGPMLNATASCDEEEAAFEHVALEPGESLGGYTHPTVPPDSNVGHAHTFSGVTIDASDFDFTIENDPHVHQVFAGTLDGKLHILDVTHNSPAGVPVDQHYHDLFLDNHQEFINRIPPYYALCYIMRVN